MGKQMENFILYHFVGLTPIYYGGVRRDQRQDKPIMTQDIRDCAVFHGIEAARIEQHKAKKLFGLSLIIREFVATNA